MTRVTNQPAIGHPASVLWSVQRTEEKKHTHIHTELKMIKTNITCYEYIGMVLVGSLRFWSITQRFKRQLVRGISFIYWLIVNAERYGKLWWGRRRERRRRRACCDLVWEARIAHRPGPEITKNRAEACKRSRLNSV